MCSRPKEGWGRRYQDCWGRAWLWLCGFVRLARSRKECAGRRSIVPNCVLLCCFDDLSVQFLGIYCQSRRVIVAILKMGLLSY